MNRKIKILMLSIALLTLTFALALTANAPGTAKAVSTYDTTFYIKNSQTQTKIYEEMFSDIGYWSAIATISNITASSFTLDLGTGQGAINYTLTGTTIAGGYSTANNVCTAGQQILGFSSTYGATVPDTGKGIGSTIEIPWEGSTELYASETIYIVFGNPSYTLTYAPGEHGSIVPVALTHSNLTALPSPLPTATPDAGYTFDGWYKTMTVALGQPTTYSNPATAGEAMSADITLYAKYTFIGFSIIYNVNGGTSVSTATGASSLPDPLPTPTKSAHTFAGWYTDSALTVSAVAGATLSADITLYAKWTYVGYTVNYNTNGGGTIARIVGASSLPDPLPTPTKSAHTFGGWYTDSALTVSAVPGATLSADITLYAKWTFTGYTVTLNTDGGALPEGAASSISNCISYPDLLPTPTKTGFAFAGWYTDSALQYAVSTVSGYPLSADTTIYAKWVTGYTLTLSLAVDGGTLPEGASSTYVDIIAIPNPLPTPTKSGYTFLGWFYDNVYYETEAVPGATLSADDTIYPKYELITYYVYNVSYIAKNAQNENTTVNFTVDSENDAVFRYGVSGVANYLDGIRLLYLDIVSHAYNNNHLFISLNGTDFVNSHDEYLAIADTSNTSGIPDTMRQCLIVNGYRVGSPTAPVIRTVGNPTETTQLYIALIDSPVFNYTLSYYAKDSYGNFVEVTDAVLRSEKYYEERVFPYAGVSLDETVIDARAVQMLADIDAYNDAHDLKGFAISPTESEYIRYTSPNINVVQYAIDYDYFLKNFDFVGYQIGDTLITADTLPGTISVSEDIDVEIVMYKKPRVTLYNVIPAPLRSDGKAKTEEWSSELYPKNIRLIIQGNPAQPYATFLGWSEAPTENASLILAELPILTEDISLYAVFEYEMVNVSLVDATSEDKDVVFAGSVKKGTYLKNIIPAKDGCKFNCARATDSTESAKLDKNEKITTSRTVYIFYKEKATVKSVITDGWNWMMGIIPAELKTIFIIVLVGVGLYFAVKFAMWLITIIKSRR